MDIGKLQEVDLREIWPNEASDFTPWIEANPQILADVLGLEMEFVREQKVGNFSLDLLGREPTSDRIIIVENQLGKSDHDHLGKLLTYAGGFEPAYVVWIASEIRSEHKAAIDWLNSVSNSETSFFALEIKAVRIGDSLPAPFLDVVAQPNAWTKQAHESRATSKDSERNQNYYTFWTSLIEQFGGDFPELRNRKAQPQLWLATSSGISSVSLNLVFTTQGLRVEYYFGSSDAELNKRRFDAVFSRSEEIERLSGRELHWEALDGKKSSRISTYGLQNASVDSTENWEAYFEWFRSAYRDMRKVASEIVSTIREADRNV